MIACTKYFAFFKVQRFYPSWLDIICLLTKDIWIAALQEYDLEIKPMKIGGRYIKPPDCILPRDLVAPRGI